MSEKRNRNISLLPVSVISGLAIYSKAPLLPPTPLLLLLCEAVREATIDDLITLSVELIRREAIYKNRDTHAALGIGKTLYVTISNFAHM
jgi:hypothetical protein